MLNILALCIVVFTISSYFIFHTQWIGLVTTALGLLCLASLVPFKVQMKNVWPDIVFGIIDNGLLAVLAIFGGEIGGVGGRSSEAWSETLLRTALRGFLKVGRRNA